MERKDRVGLGLILIGVGCTFAGAVLARDVISAEVRDFVNEIEKGFEKELEK